MTDRRDDAIEGVKSLLEAVDDLEEMLDVARGNCRIALASLVEGKPVRDALDDAAASRTRQALTDSLDRFEQFRHNSRLSLIAAGMEEGSTINSIGRTWGISRQLASRLVKETRSGS